VSENRVGTCHNCGGAVIADWQAVHPIPHCIECGHIADYAVNTTPSVVHREDWDDLIAAEVED
jgi:hypothetical protein